VGVLAMKTVPPRPANVLEASQYTSPWAVHEPERALTREDLARAADLVRNARRAYDFPRVEGEQVDMWRSHVPMYQPPGRGPVLINADGRAYSPEDWYAIALASHAVAEFLRWGAR
jgi:hypothetical protein